MRRNARSYQHIDPDLVGNEMRVVVSELSGRGNLLSKAEELGLDRAAFKGCLRSDRHADVVTANLRLAEQLDVYSTPTVLVRSRGLPTRPESDFQSIANAVEALKSEG